MRKLLQFTLLTLFATLFSVTAGGQTLVTFVAGTDKGSETDNNHTNNNGSDQVTKDGVTILKLTITKYMNM